MIKFHGEYLVTCHGADGATRWQERVKNAVTNVGLNHLLGVTLKDVTRVTAWYLGLIDNVSYVRLTASDTMASHPEWIEYVAYTETERQTWTPAAAATQSISNGASAAVFTFTAGAVIRGLFLNSINTKSGTTGTLFSTAVLSAPQTVAASDTITLTYAVSAASA